MRACVCLAADGATLYTTASDWSSYTAIYLSTSSDYGGSSTAGKLTITAADGGSFTLDAQAGHRIIHLIAGAFDVELRGVTLKNGDGVSAAHHPAAARRRRPRPLAAAQLQRVPAASVSECVCVSVRVCVTDSATSPLEVVLLLGVVAPGCRWCEEASKDAAHTG